MNKIAQMLTYKIAPEQYKNNLEELEVAAYGMEGLLCNFTTLGLAFLISILFHTTYELFLMLLYFIPLRSSYKSFHCKTFKNCLVMSNLAVLLATLTIQHLSYISGYFFVSLLVIWINYLLSSEKNIKMHIILTVINMLILIINKDYLVTVMISLIINTVLLLLKRGEIHEKV
ncbi:accessory gene regulator B family protein [[Clostridium] spiroforme]|nr:accessory gene regulator B family protein [Thomasclavelia spiroformis]MBM6880498.1 accessory gene regulator B family protein [Thomasclavelia spiroformis]